MRVNNCVRAAALIALASVSLPRTNGLSSSDASAAGRGRTNGDAMGAPTPRLLSVTTTAPESPERTRKRKRKVSSAPLVDSTLLRFVSEQKRRQEEQLAWEPEGVLPSGVTTTPTPLLTNKRFFNKSSSATAAENERVLNPEAVLDSLAASLQGQDQLDPWMGQFNRYRVAQELVALGADAESAMQAGEKVQNYVLTRTARRRIRIFLRERDTLWNKADDQLATSQLQQLVDNKVLRLGISHPNYGFSDVVELMAEFGLTGKDICTILAHSPNVAMMMPRMSLSDLSDSDDETITGSSGETLEETMNRSFVGLLQTDLGLRKFDARKVLRESPGLLSMRGSKSAVQIVTMMSKLGVSKSAIARDKTALPLLLSRSPAAVFRLVSFLCSDKVRMPIGSIGPLLRRPVSRELVDKLAPVPKLQQTMELDMDEEELAEIHAESADWGKYREERVQTITALYKNMTATATALRFEVGTKDLGKLIAAYPSVLLLDAEEQILPVARFLVEELGIWEDGLAAVLQQYPMLLGRDIDEMKEVAAFLKYIGVQEDDLGRMLKAFPALLTMDPQKDMSPVIDFLIEIGVSDVGAFVTTLPPVLGYSIEKELRPKWEFLQKVCLRPTFEINNFPAYFSYPFDRVIRTRYDYLAAKGIARQLVPVDAVVRFGDADFATKVARDEDGGKVYRAFCDKRNQAGRTNQKKNRGQSRPKQAIRSSAP